MKVVTQAYDDRGLNMLVYQRIIFDQAHGGYNNDEI